MQRMYVCMYVRNVYNLSFLAVAYVIGNPDLVKVFVTAFCLGFPPEVSENKA